MNIRPATKEDLKQCEAIFNLRELYTASGHNLTAEFVVNYLNEKYFLVAEDEGQIVGAIYGEPLKAGGVVIWVLAVLSDKRGQGIGSALLMALEENTRSDGRKWLYLNAPAQKPATINFYKKHGYDIGQTYIECAKNL
ncbi:MAG: GNAT family N-acetyltransferase [Patescibacteria group bacterium]